MSLFDRFPVEIEYQEYMLNYFKSSNMKFDYNAIYIGYMYSLKLFYKYYKLLCSEEGISELIPFEDFSVNNNFKQFLSNKIDNCVINNLVKNAENENKRFNASYLISDNDMYNYIINNPIDFVLGCTLHYPLGYRLPENDEILLSNLLNDIDGFDNYLTLYMDDAENNQNAENDELYTYAIFKTNKILKDIDSNIGFRVNDDTNNSM